MGKASRGRALGWLLLFLPVVAACATVSDSGYIVPDGGDGDGHADEVSVPEDGAACDVGQIHCGSECVDPMSDSRHCGGCGNPCAAEEICSAGVCAGDCTAPLARCGSVCVNLATSADNCGRCGNACPGAPNADGVCEASACTLRCRPGWSDSDGLPGCEYECSLASPTESCNGVDDNCDGETDEGFPCRVGESVSCTTSCGSGGTGSCSLACEIPNGPACTPPAESCNGLDDDCDTVCDNGLGCCQGQAGSCTTSTGAPGSHTCSATCAWGTCTATGEACNGVDDDGDTRCDEDFDCCLGATGTCLAVCGSTGTRNCSASCTWNPCTPPPESCNGIDDDCDGICDNGVGECCRGASGACTTGCGSTGTRTCSGSCTWTACNPPAETCNGLDDNCNGLCDDGYSCCAGSTQACTTSCGTAGSQSCSAVCSLTTCCAAAEVCGNGCDDNCNGSIDEGCSTGNDTCAGATPLTLSAGRTTTSGTTVGAGNDGGCNTGPDVWYRFSLTQREVVSINTFGSSYDTVLALRAGSCGAATAFCTDDVCGVQTEITATLDPGTYYIIVGGYLTAAGSFTLNIEHLPVGSDGVATLLAVGSTTQSGTTVGTGVVDGSCRMGTAPEHLYYWTQCSYATGGAFSANTCTGTSYDSVIYLRSGQTGADLVCNDDSCSLQSSITATVPAGFGLFGFYVDGFYSNSGSYSAAITRP
jgi:hypothetical protein